LVANSRATSKRVLTFLILYPLNPAALSLANRWRALALVLNVVLAASHRGGGGGGCAKIGSGEDGGTSSGDDGRGGRSVGDGDGDSLARATGDRGALGRWSMVVPHATVTMASATVVRAAAIHGFGLRVTGPVIDPLAPRWHADPASRDCGRSGRP
jgi:hypothetical protein